MNDYNIHFFKGIEPDELEAFSRIVANANDGDVITMDFCNGGGSVFHGIAICDMMNAARERGVKFISNVWGYAASAACLVALSADEVYMSENAAIMYHSAWCPYGSEDDPGIVIANNAQRKLLAGRISKISAKDFDGDDHWITSREALDLGIINGFIGNNNNTETEDSRSIHLVAQYIFGGHVMTKAEEIMEQEEIKKDEVVEAAEGSDNNDQNECKSEAPSMEDLMEALVQRLDEIEHRLAVLEGEGKKEDDEQAPASPAARRAALLARISSVCAPVAPVAQMAAPTTTVESSDARHKAIYKDFESIVAKEIRRGNRR